MNASSSQPAVVSSAMWEILADTGGTFTDCLGCDPAGRWHRAKVLSTGAVRATVVARPNPQEILLELPAGDWPEGFFAGFTVAAALAKNPAVEIIGFPAFTNTIHLASPAPADWMPGALLTLDSGEEAPVLGARVLTRTPRRALLPPLALRLATTRGTNALLEDRGAPVVFFVTEGFGDLLEIGDQRRPDLFALHIVKPPPLARWVVEVPERLDARGGVVRVLDEAEFGTRLATVKKNWPPGAMAAVALLHADLNPAHEQQVAKLLHAAGFPHVSQSAQLAPFVKILPRAQTAVINAALAPVMDAYFDGVARSLGGGRLRVAWSRAPSAARAIPC